jgi:FAD/FMN-containing dehydrogenase
VTQAAARAIGDLATVDPAPYAMSHAAPRFAARPASREALLELLTAAARDRLAIVPWGGGVALAHEPAPGRHDLALDLGAFDRVIEHNPDDLTLTAECGITIAALRRLLATHRQDLPLEAAHGDRATLGGVLAANASGPRRLRFGSPRDRILGARFALTDGTVARSGGKVVKNVAGYGIHRLLCGSHGGLALILEASLKLAPAPEQRVALIYAANPRDLVDTARWSFLPRLEPSYVTVVSAALAGDVGARSAGACSVIVGLEDDRPWLAQQEAAVARALGAPESRIEGDEAAALAVRLADLEESHGPRVTFTTRGNTPAALGPIASQLGDRFVFHALAGRLHVFGDRPLTTPERFTRIGSRGIPASAETSSTGVMTLRQRIHAALDPAGLLALGERWAIG